ncbi:NAD(P)/FAD-dependent oxidoreductase [Paracoccus albus]|uniref:NAD(P)/FAD-dependent oxidoreductase n=1 Tax=Paracoccus albus TaxID=3017784 RepID=UPI0022EFDC63|nr:FAD-binding oxidoreductase [Paracoccus albus]WBU59304.1 FAD-binding oxidoreductase [Paracoccus albus]
MAVKRHVAVIGAGVIGAIVAARLLADSHRVTVIEPDPPGGPHCASFGNGGFLSPASIIPMSAPNLWRKVPGMLRDPKGALTIRWRHLPALSPWLWRFLMAGRSPQRVEETARALNQLLSDAPARHRALADSIGRPEFIRNDGLIYAFHDRAAFETDAPAWNIRQRLGVRMQELGEEELRDLLPALSPLYRFAIRITDGGHCTDPGGYVSAICDWVSARGGKFHAARATGFDLSGGRLGAVQTDRGPVACDAAVIANGIRAPRLARLAGERIPLQSERGYFVQIAGTEGIANIPVMPQDGRMANIQVAGGLRASGQVELASPDARPDWRRADILLAHLRTTWPGLKINDQNVSRWMGHRPSTPDGRPVIGRASASADIIHAFGHGHIGLASAPATAEIVADLIAGRTPASEITPFAPARFRRSR